VSAELLNEFDDLSKSCTVFHLPNLQNSKNTVRQKYLLDVIGKIAWNAVRPPYRSIRPNESLFLCSFILA
jgi:hypothetical protein